MLTKLTRWLFFVMLIELVLGGGRLISFGPVSLRMILFSCAILLTAIHILVGKQIEKNYRQLLLMFAVMIGVGVIMGFFEGADKKLIWEDVKPLLFFLLLPFFGIAIEDTDVPKINKIIIVCASVMAVCFLLVVFLLSIDVISFQDFYDLTSSTEELFYRGEVSFFYKGFTYLCIGFLLVHFQSERKSRWLMALLSIAIFLTFTRGLVLALALTYTVHYFFIKRNIAKMSAAILICIVFLFFGGDIYAALSRGIFTITTNQIVKQNPNASEKLLGDRDYSDEQRLTQIKQVANSLTFKSVFLGHGFGVGVVSRPIHMEISYLEIFHKQGLVGLCFWGFFLITLIRSFKRAIQINPRFATPVFLAALFVFFESLTNQYINNPIGMGMVLISLVSLNALPKTVPR